MIDLVSFIAIIAVGVTLCFGWALIRATTIQRHEQMRHAETMRRRRERQFVWNAFMDGHEIDIVTGKVVWDDKPFGPFHL